VVLMNKTALIACATLLALGGCNAAKDEKSAGTQGNAGAVAMTNAVTPGGTPAVANVTAAAAVAPATVSAPVAAAGGGTSVIATAADGTKATVTNDGALPEFAPQYPGSTMGVKQSVASPDGTVFTATMTTMDPIASILAFYKPKLLAAGLPIAMEQVATDSGMMMGGQRARGPQAERVSKVTTVIITVKTVGGKNEIGLLINQPGT
jgi:hypothetical protein